jgi:hypothetical protein
MPIGELPGRISNFAGRVKEGAKNTFGMNPSGLSPEQEAFGMNPRRAYWSAALGDLANVTMGQPFQNRGMQVNAAQQQHMQALEQQKQQEELKREALRIQELNALKERQGQDPTIIREARELYPNDPEAQRQYVENYRNRAPMQVNISDKNQGQYIGDMLKNVPESYEAAISAADEISRYDTMEQLIPYIGTTGNTKEFMVNLRGGLNSLGLGRVADFMGALGEAAGVDFFSGDQGAAELFRALSRNDVLNRARELYPVSDRDIAFLQETAVTLKMSDPEAMTSMLKRNRQAAQRRIDFYNWQRQTLSGYQGIPPLPEVVPYDIDRIRNRASQLEQELFGGQ